MRYPENPYLDLTTYQEIYRELVYQRNAAISWLEEHGLLERMRVVEEKDKRELTRHYAAMSYRPIFHDNVVQLLDRLYSHDAIEALYDFKTYELGEWSDTETNRLERELQRLQLIIGKLEQRYDLRYRVIFEYNKEQGALLLNSNKVLTCGLSTVKHRLLTTLFSSPRKLWGIDDIDKYFHENFDYVRGELKERNIEKAGNDIKAQVALKTGVQDLLLVTKSSIRLHSSYIV